LAACLLFGQAKPPVQPVPYSHKVHLKLGLQCKDCHKNADPGEVMGLPATSTCMNCHKSIKADSPHVQKIAESDKAGKPLPWVRVYKIPSYVFFSHRAHLETGAACQTCHGPVAERDVLAKEVDISMGGCMDCHRRNKASTDCLYCHEQKQ
jgi:hypothetical protein